METVDQVERTEMISIIDKFSSVGFIVEFRYDQVSVCHPMHGRFLVCYKRRGEWSYEEELNAAFDALQERGYVCDSADSTKGTAATRPAVKYVKRKPVGQQEMS